MQAAQRLPPANPVNADEILVGKEYEAVREQRRAHGRALRNRRRVTVGPFISVVFENHDTALHQLHEILRAEGTSDPELIKHELEVYNELIAPPGCLSGTLFVEWQDLKTIREKLDTLLGLDQATYLIFADGSRCKAFFDPYTQDEFRLSAVQYLLFELTEAQRELLKKGEGPVRLVVEHDNYDHSAGLSAELIKDLGSEL